MPEVYIHIDGRLKTNFHRNENLLSKFKIGNGHLIGIYVCLSWILVSRKPNGQEYPIQHEAQYNKNAHQQQQQ